MMVQLMQLHFHEIYIFVKIWFNDSGKIEQIFRRSKVYKLLDSNSEMI